MKLHDPRFLSFDGEPITGRTPPTLIVKGDALSERQAGEVAHAYKLFRDALQVAITPYLVQHRVLNDGTTVKMVSINGVDTVTVEPPTTHGNIIVPRVYSGVIRDGQIVDVPPLVLRDFRPTLECWNFPLNHSGAVPFGEFSDIKQLAVPKTDGGGAGDSKYTDVQASKFSGRMAKVVQVILGYGIEPPASEFSTRVLYDYTAGSCHGVAKGADNTAWLVEISAARGVLAMPLPLLKNTKRLTAAPEHVLSEMARLIGGLPSGHTFPTGTALTDAITAGDVLQLLTTTDLATYNAKTPFSSDIGWSFNEDGTEAHNVVYYATGTSYPASGTTPARAKYNSCHYKIVFSFGALATSRSTGDPIATCSAVFSLVQEAEMRDVAAFGTTAGCQFSFYSPVSGKMDRAPIVPTLASEIAGLASSFDYPVLACHIDGVLDVVRIRTYTTANTLNGSSISTLRRTSMTSDQFPDGDHPSVRSQADLSSPQFKTDLASQQAGMWAGGARDGYIMVEAIDFDTHTVSGLQVLDAIDDFLWKVLTERGDTIALAPEVGGTITGGVLSGNTGRSQLMSTGALDTKNPAFANVSVFGNNLHAVYTTDLLPATTPRSTGATGSLLSGEPTAKPVDPITGKYPWKTYAYAGYL